MGLDAQPVLLPLMEPNVPTANSSCWPCIYYTERCLLMLNYSALSTVILLVLLHSSWNWFSVPELENEACKALVNYVTQRINENTVAWQSLSWFLTKPIPAILVALCIVSALICTRIFELISCFQQYLTKGWRSPSLIKVLIRFMESEER